MGRPGTIQISQLDKVQLNTGCLYIYIKKEWVGGVNAIARGNEWTSSWLLDELVGGFSGHQIEHFHHFLGQRIFKFKPFLLMLVIFYTIRSRDII